MGGSTASFSRVHMSCIPRYSLFVKRKTGMHPHPHPPPLGGRDGRGCRLMIHVIVLMILELHLIEPLIRAPARQEIIMAAYFDHTTSGQDDDPVGSLDC